MTARDPEPLGPTLERAKSTLKTALDTACRTNVDRADTGELIRIEEVLAIANEAAKEAISVRRRIGSRRPDTTQRDSSGSREIEDGRGTRWSVFPVHPSATGKRSTLREQFRDGWLSFDCGDETRRIAPIPTDWHRLSDDELTALCEQAEPAVRRNRSTQSRAADGVDE